MNAFYIAVLENIECQEINTRLCNINMPSYGYMIYQQTIFVYLFRSNVYCSKLGTPPVLFVYFFI